MKIYSEKKFYLFAVDYNFKQAAVLYVAGSGVTLKNAISNSETLNQCNVKYCNIKQCNI